MANASAVNKVTETMIAHFVELKAKPKTDYVGLAEVVSAYTDKVVNMSLVPHNLVFLQCEVEAGVWSVTFRGINGEVPAHCIEVVLPF